MKRSIWVFGITALLLVVPGSRALGTEQLSPDEAWWNDLPNASRTVAVITAIDAYEMGFGDGASQMAAVAQQRRPKSLKARFSHTFGFYVSAIDDFYVRFPNGSRATIAEVMACLADNPVFTCKQTADMSAEVQQ